MTKILLLVLFVSITSQSFAQYQPKSDAIFEIPAANIKRKFLIELGRNDKMQIELTDIRDLARIRNIDSLVGMYLRDIYPLRDSLGEGVFSRRIDYIVDTSIHKKIRIQRFDPKPSYYAVHDGEVALLRLEQDTICIMGRERGKVKAGIFGSYDDFNYYRVSFYLNKLQNLQLYVDGKLNEKVAILERELNSVWGNKEPSGVYLKKDPDITAPYLRGYSELNRTYSLRIGLGLQNYKNYFVPSISGGFMLSRTNNIVRQRVGLQYENHFYFSRTGGGKLETFKNDFVTVMYERRIMLENPNGSTRLSRSLSFSYLTRRSGDYFEKHTMRIGVGGYAPWGGSLRVEPAFYFVNFLKRVTPSLRVIQYF